MSEPSFVMQPKLPSPINPICSQPSGWGKVLLHSWQSGPWLIHYEYFGHRWKWSENSFFRTMEPMRRTSRTLPFLCTVLLSRLLPLSCLETHNVDVQAVKRVHLIQVSDVVNHGICIYIHHKKAMSKSVVWFQLLCVWFSLLLSSVHTFRTLTLAWYG